MNFNMLYLEKNFSFHGDNEDIFKYFSNKTTISMVQN